MKNEELLHALSGCRRTTKRMTSGVRNVVSRTRNRTDAVDAEQSTGSPKLGNPRDAARRTGSRAVVGVETRPSSASDSTNGDQRERERGAARRRRPGSRGSSSTSSAPTERRPDDQAREHGTVHHRLHPPHRDHVVGRGSRRRRPGTPARSAARCRSAAWRQSVPLAATALGDAVDDAVDQLLIDDLPEERRERARTGGR